MINVQRKMYAINVCCAGRRKLYQRKEISFKWRVSVPYNFCPAIFQNKYYLQSMYFVKMDARLRSTKRTTKPVGNKQYQFHFIWQDISRNLFINYSIRTVRVMRSFSLRIQLFSAYNMNWLIFIHTAAPPINYFTKRNGKLISMKRRTRRLT